MSEVIHSPNMSAYLIVEMLSVAMHIDTSCRVRSCSMNAGMSFMGARQGRNVW